MPDYCDTVPEIDTVPPPSEMRLFKPYFTIPEGCSSFVVCVMVDNAGYFIVDSMPGAPPEGACGTQDDLQQCITIKKDAAKSSAVKTMLTATISYRENPDGHKINVYVIDLSDGGKVKGESKSKGRLH